MTSQRCASVLVNFVVLSTCLSCSRTESTATKDSSPEVLSAAVKAAEDGSIEDAAYLTATGLMRAMIDFNLYPSSDPSETQKQAQKINQLLEQLHVNNGKLMADRDRYSKVIRRLEQWAPNVDDQYSPPWDHAGNTDVAARLEYVEQIKEDHIDEMHQIATLLADDEYHSLCCQLFALTTQNEQADQLVEQLTAIEKRRRIEGLFYKKTN